MDSTIRTTERVSASRFVEASFSEVVEELRKRPDHLMAIAFPAAGPIGDGRVDAFLTVQSCRRWLRIPTRIEFSTPASGHADAVIHIRWQARRHPLQFPTMDADIKVHSANSLRTELLLVGEYCPPLGLMGFIADRVLGGRAAISAVGVFLEDLADAVVTECASHVRSD